jgi:hypothetical protein
MQLKSRIDSARHRRSQDCGLQATVADPGRLLEHRRREMLPGFGFSLSFPAIRDMLPRREEVAWVAQIPPQTKPGDNVFHRNKTI